MIRRVFGNGHKAAQSALEVTSALGSASVASVQGLAPVALGAGLNRNQVPKRAHDPMESHTAGSRHRPQTLSPDSESRDGSTLRAVHLVPQWIRICWRRAEGKRARGEALRVSTRGRTGFYGA